MNIAQAPPMHSRIKTRQLLLMTQLDREGSVLHAAGAAGMSQPAASKLLRELEEALGVALFERHARGVVPTAYGAIVVRHAHTILSEIRKVQEEVEALKRGETYRVAIGSVVSPGAELLPQALAMLERSHPQMVVKVQMDTSRPLVAKLIEGQLDIVIGRVLDLENAAGLDFEALAEEPHSLIARAGHPLSAQRTVDFKDLVDYPWALPPQDSILRERINAMFALRGLSLPARIVETSWLALISNMLRLSDMLVALPQEVVQPYCDAGMLCVLPIELNVRMDTFGIITRRDYAYSGDVHVALKALREAARTVYGRGENFKGARPATGAVGSE